MGNPTFGVRVISTILSGSARDTIELPMKAPSPIVFSPLGSVIDESDVLVKAFDKMTSVLSDIS